MTDVPDDAIGGAILSGLAAVDVFASKPASARDIRERLFGDAASDDTPTQESVERTLRDLHAAGLVDAFHEPYIHPRYLINRAGREHMIEPAHGSSGDA